MFKYLNIQEGDLVAIQSSGKLDQEDLDALLPEMEKRMELYGRIRFYWEMAAFEGWTPAAFVQDRIFDLKHRQDFRKIALVGDRHWQQTAARIMDRFFAGADVRFFDLDQQEEARRWIQED